jgi:hypothetical protein
MKIKIIFLLFILSGTIVAQDKNRLFSPEELKADVDYYYETLYSKHPNPYHYYSLSEFEDVKNRVYERLNKPLTKEQFSRIILELNSCVDRHSQIHARNYLTQADIDSINKLKLFPRVKIKDGKVFFRDKTENLPIREIIDKDGNKKDLIIHKRFSENKLLFHFPININFLKNNFNFTSLE